MDAVEGPPNEPVPDDFDVDPKLLAKAAIAALEHFVRDEGSPDVALATADALLLRLRATLEADRLTGGEGWSL